MIKLETDYENENTVKYFNTLQECEEYLYVFKDHWCNVKWKEPIKVSDISNSNEKEYMKKSPKERAEADLSWGFSMMKLKGGEELNKDQSVFLDDFLKTIV